MDCPLSSVTVPAGRELDMVEELRMYVLPSTNTSTMVFLQRCFQKFVSLSITSHALLTQAFSSCSLRYWYFACISCLVVQRGLLGFPGGASDKEPTYQCRLDVRDRIDPWVGRISWRRMWQPTPVFLPGESPGQRSLAGYNL